MALTPIVGSIANVDDDADEIDGAKAWQVVLVDESLDCIARIKERAVADHDRDILFDPILFLVGTATVRVRAGSPDLLRRLSCKQLWFLLLLFIFVCMLCLCVELMVMVVVSL